ncbi:MAG: hypothetical protein R3C29_17725 [Dehalococcoidia bacterium]
MTRRTKFLIAVGAALLLASYLRLWGPVDTRDWAEKKWCNTLGFGKYTGSWSGREQKGPTVGQLVLFGEQDARLFARDMIRLEKTNRISGIAPLLEDDPQFVQAYYPIPQRAVENRMNHSYMVGFRRGIQTAIKDWADGRLSPLTPLPGDSR